MTVLFLYCEGCGAHFGCIEGLDEIPALGQDRHLCCSECAPDDRLAERPVETVEVKEPVL